MNTTNEKRVKALKKSNDELFATSRRELGGRIAVIRKRCGLTQQEIALSLDVAVSTISRIECGEHMPTRYLLRPMFQMFNMSLEDSIAMLLDGGDSYEDDMFDELRIAIRDEAYGKLSQLLTRIDEKSLAGKGLYKRLFLFSQILTEELETHTAVNRMTEALRVIRKEFTLNSIPAYRLCFDEVMIVSEIGRRYFAAGEYDKAAKIFEDTAGSVDTYYFNEHSKSETIPGILLNLSACYGVMGRYQEAEQVCKDAYDLAARYGKFGTLPYLLDNIGMARFHQGDRVGCLEMIMDAYITAKAMGKQTWAETIKTDAEKNLGIDLSNIKEQLLASFSNLAAKCHQAQATQLS
jgi:transcriptional regulator with XRE-family HTH domain